MFGHIKKVYIDSTGESGDIWLQASSGMYLLPFANVASDYKDELVNFLMANGIKSEMLLLPGHKNDSSKELVKTCSKLLLCDGGLGFEEDVETNETSKTNV